ncbi:MAG: FAD-dependent oxidoreductase [Ignavibacteriales bacterium]
MPKKIVIVGGVAGGASAAARLRRLDEFAEIIMVEKGPDISFANCGLPYYVSGVISRRDSLLVQTPAAMRSRFNIDVRVLSEVTRIIPDVKEIEITEAASGRIYKENYDVLILSPGASPIVPSIPGADLDNVFTVRNLPDIDRIKGWVDQKNPSSAVVVGGGFIGLEMAENLKQRGLQVTLVEAANQVMAPLDIEMAKIVHRYLLRQGIDLRLNDGLLSMEGDKEVRKVKLASGASVSADMVVLGIGVRPEAVLAKNAGLKVGVTGGIEVGETLQTSDPSIYAIGDAIQVKSYVGGNEVLIPLAGPANKQGRLVADVICGRNARYEGTLGTAIAKLFDLSVAATGLNEKNLKKLGRPYQVSYTHPAPHATYYPGGANMSMKLIFDPTHGDILGAQIVGFQGVDKRIDVLATCIRKGLNIFDLQELELAYAPPFSSAKDPVNMAGYVAGNIINGDVDVVQWQQVDELMEQGALLLDVRMPGEVKMGAIEGCLNIPLDDLRDHLHELPKDRLIIAYCRVGLRGYLAARILKQHGFTMVKNLSGGFLTYDPAVDP